MDQSLRTKLVLLKHCEVCNFFKRVKHIEKDEYKEFCHSAKKSGMTNIIRNGSTKNYGIDAFPTYG